MASSISAGTTSSTALVATADTTGALVLQTNNGTTALTLSTAQNATFAGTLTTAAQGIAKASLPAGSVLQVVNAIYTTAVSSSTSNTFVDSGLTLSITPTSSTSKILVIVNQATTAGSGANSENQTVVTLLRGSTNLFSTVSASSDDFFRLYTPSSNSTLSTYLAFNYLDSPATTSSTTYKTQFSMHYGTTATVQKGSSPSFITLMEIAA
jgi:hypothetical protein